MIDIAQISTVPRRQMSLWERLLYAVGATAITELILCALAVIWLQVCVVLVMGPIVPTQSLTPVCTAVRITITGNVFADKYSLNNQLCLSFGSIVGEISRMSEHFG